MVETRTLRLKLSSPNPESDGWSFIQSLTNTCQTPKQNEPSYVNPMTKISSYSKLNSRSLELCTENLGCETGSHLTENAFFSLPSREHNGGENNERVKFRSRRCSDNREKSTGNFPPPLTTMSGWNSLQVRPIRAGGRLIIEVIEAPSDHGCFQTERSNGRLILSLNREIDETTSSDEIYKNEIEELENELHCQKEEENIEDGEKCEQVGVIIGTGKVQRPTRCNEGGLCKWEPFLVATS